MAKKKEITKQAASKAATIVRNYAIQEGKKGAKKGAIATRNATKKAAQKGFSKLKNLFK